MFLRKFLYAAGGVIVGSLVYKGVGLLCWLLHRSALSTVVQIVTLIAMTIVGLVYLYNARPIMLFGELFLTMLWFGPAVFVLIWWGTGTILTVHTAESWFLSLTKFIARMVLIPLLGGGIPLFFLRGKSLF